MAYNKLSRSAKDSKIAGVCGGLGVYLDIDPNVLRIIFILLLIFGSTGLWIYLIMWIILPLDPMI